MVINTAPSMRSSPARHDVRPRHLRHRPMHEVLKERELKTLFCGKFFETKKVWRCGCEGLVHPVEEAVLGQVRVDHHSDALGRDTRWMVEPSSLQEFKNIWRSMVFWLYKYDPFGDG